MAWFEDVVFFSVAVRCPWRLNSHSAKWMCLTQKPSRCHRLMCPRLQRDCMPYVLWPAAPEHHLQLPFRICLPKPAWSMLTAPLALPQAHVRSRCRMPAPVVTSAHHCDALMLDTIAPHTLSCHDCLVQVGYTMPWAALSSELGYFKMLHGPNFLLFLNLAYFLPSVPILLLQLALDQHYNWLFGTAVSTLARQGLAQIICAICCLALPFLPWTKYAPPAAPHAVSQHGPCISHRQRYT